MSNAGTAAEKVSHQLREKIVHRTPLKTVAESAKSARISAMSLTPQQAWLQAYFGTPVNSGNAADSADPDGDGLTNIQEFIAGTDPTDRTSLLKADQIRANGRDMAVNFPTAVGRIYRVERSDTLQGGPWTTMQDNIIGTGRTLEVTDLGASSVPKRFIGSSLHRNQE